MKRPDELASQQGAAASIQPVKFFAVVLTLALFCADNTQKTQFIMANWQMQSHVRANNHGASAMFCSLVWFAYIIGDYVGRTEFMQKSAICTLRLSVGQTNFSTQRSINDIVT
jgi:hypothetical protein